MKSILPGRRLPDAVAAILLFAILALAGLYLAAIGPYWNISPDSALYVGNARSLAAGRGLELPGPHPPVTSLVFAPVVALFPVSYLPLNALIKVLFLLSFLLAYRLVAPRNGRLHALLVVLLSLGFVRTFEESTRLLSEPVYAFLTFLFLVLAERQPSEPDGRRLLAAGGVLLLVALTRTVGLTLILAVLVHELSAPLARGSPKRSPSLLLLAMAALAALAMFAWKAWVAAQHVPVWEAYLPPGAAFGPARDSIDWLDWVFRNRNAMVAVGGLLTNAWDLARGDLAFSLHVVALLFFLGGLIGDLRDRVSVTGLYIALYLVVITGQMILGSGLPPFRLLVPVAPLLFHYALLGAGVGYGRLTAAFGRRAARVLHTAAVFYLVGYLVVGVRGIVERIPDEHRSLFGDYPIKRSGGLDAQRLALWLRDHAPPGERFAALQSDMWEVVSERDGVDLVIGAAEPTEFLKWLQANRIRYVLIDRSLPFAERIVEPSVAAYPERFRPLLELPSAILYQIRTISDRSPTAPESRPVPR